MVTVFPDKEQWLSNAYRMAPTLVTLFETLQSMATSPIAVSP